MSLCILAAVLLALTLRERVQQRRHRIDYLGSVLMTIFLLHQRCVPEPMLPSSLWRDRMISAGNVASLASGASMMCITAFLPAFIQHVMGYPHRPRRQ